VNFATLKEGRRILAPLYQWPKSMTRHGRACPGHPKAIAWQSSARRPAAASQDEKPRIFSLFLSRGISFTAWMAGTSPAMTPVSIFGNWCYGASAFNKNPCRFSPAIELGVENRCAGAATAASRRFEPQRPPQFAGNPNRVTRVMSP
jgi:hypothetical protein